MRLRLTQRDVEESGEKRHRVEVRLEGEGAPRVAEDVRWYLPATQNGECCM